MLKNTNMAYGTVAKSFHWGIALLIITLVTVGLIMADMPASPLKWQLYNIHKATGIVVFGLACLRLIWRWMNPTPQVEVGVPILVKWAANANIKFLYVLMFLYPLSGYLMSTFGGHPIDLYGLYVIQPLGQNPEIGKRAHFFHTFILEYLLIFSFGAHVMGALYHHFIRKDQTLRKII